MGLGDWLLIGRLKRAIQKVRFLLTFNMIKFRISALSSSRRLTRLSSSSSSATSRRQLSFNEALGLLDYAAPATANDDLEIGSPPAIFSTSSIDYGDDIDKRAEAFIANFYRHIQMERQVSLELRYCNNRLERTRSD